MFDFDELDDFEQQDGSNAQIADVAPLNEAPVGLASGSLEDAKSTSFAADTHLSVVSLQPGDVKSQVSEEAVECNKIERLQEVEECTVDLQVESTAKEDESVACEGVEETLVVHDITQAPPQANVTEDLGECQVSCADRSVESCASMDEIAPGARVTRRRSSHMRAGTLRGFWRLAGLFPVVC